MEKFSYAGRQNLEFIDSLFSKYKSNPESVDPDWKRFFEGVEFAQNLDSPSEGSFSSKELGVYNLIQAYRDHGHQTAHLDPLKLQSPEPTEILNLKTYGLASSDLETSFEAGKLLGLQNTTLKNIIEHLEKSYCHHLTAQVSGCEKEVRDWFHQEIESGSPTFRLSADKKKEILRYLVRAESLEKFLHTRYVGTKRFSIEGGDALIPMLETLVQTGTAHQVEEIVVGMAHRGRLNVLANYMGKATEDIFAEFDGSMKSDEAYSGDVKYHLGYSADKATENGDCHISLAFNPSHLEAVNPVVLGMVRAKQRRRNDTEDRKKVIPLLIHGDAAFAGQGVVSETLQLSKLDGYKVGGCIHVIINNQVGFTTDPSDSRSTRYSSDIANSIKAPVILVNGDDVEACARAMDMATRFRQEFKQDIVIDLICYRRFGHNEGDEPNFTQPKMYQVIKKHPTLMKIYDSKLVEEGVLQAGETDAFYKEKIDNLQNELDEVRENPPEEKKQVFAGLWEGLRRGRPEDFETSWPTGTSKENLLEVATHLTKAPEQIKLNNKVTKLLQNRAKMIETNSIDWGLGELLTYGTLLKEGTPVRISGQDVKRGTFTHRHAVYFDQESGQEFCPLKENFDSEFCIYNSLLSEMAVLGFEYGNSISDPTFLTIWEAQFGDFANGAQIIIDQFISSGEEKWARMAGLVMLLPHGYEGQGPEHSSARLERFLQLCAGDSMQVCNLTTPANLFHCLRRQVKRDFRKPLIIMSPKSLLRHAKVVSPIEDFVNGPFQEVILDPNISDPNKVENLLLCSGKVYYDIDKAREEAGYPSSTAVVRLEQICPFPKTQLTPFLHGFPKLKKVAWVQEEPQNMGSFHYVQNKITGLLNEIGLTNVEFSYIGREDRSSPATGSPKVHLAEQNAIIKKCLEL